MSLSLSVVLPYTPLLIPNIGKDNTKKLQQTINSYSKIEKKLIDSKINTIILISMDENINQDFFYINASPKFSYNFEDFGDSSKNFSWRLNTELAYSLRENLIVKNKLKLINQEELAYSFSVPLVLLTSKLPNIKIIPIYCSSNIINEEHFKFGELIKQDIKKTTDNVAIISSCHLSTKLDKKSPAGYSSKSKKADQKIIDLLKTKKIHELLSMNQDYINEAGEYGIKQILLQQGIMKDFLNEPKLLSYEAPFGIGYMVMDYQI